MLSEERLHDGSDADLNDLELILESGLSEDEYFQHCASGNVLQTTDFRKTLLFGMIAGVGTLMFLGEAIALVVAALFAESIWSRHTKASKSLKEIRDGNFVPYLDEYDRRAYLRLKALPAGEESIDEGDIDEPAIAGAAMPPWAKDWNSTQKELWDRLIKDCPQMTLPIFSKLVVISGPQQTGKSSLASAIAYCRFILRGDPTIAVTPHVDGKKMFSGLLVGAGGDFEEIEAWYEDMVSKFEMGGDRRTILIDELSQYTGDWERLGQNIVRTALTESDKHGYSPILINHAQTVSAGFSGIPGVKALIDSSAIRILRQYKLSDWGEQTRSNVIAMELPSGEKLSSTVPDWFHLPTLQSDFPAPQPQPSEVAKLNRMLELPAEPNPFDAKHLVEPTLTIPQQHLVDFAKKKGDWLTARDVKNNCGHFKMGDYSTSDIRGIFVEVSHLGIGTVEGEGDRLKYKISP